MDGILIKKTTFAYTQKTINLYIRKMV